MRPAQMADLNEVQRMAADSPIGVTSLPDDSARLATRLPPPRRPCRGGQLPARKATSSCSKTAKRRLAGCSAIVLGWLFRAVLQFSQRDLRARLARAEDPQQDPRASLDLTGNSLLTSFYVLPELVNSGWAELNRGRLLFMAAHPERFADSVVTEIVGYSDERANRRSGTPLQFLRPQLCRCRAPVRPEEPHLSPNMPHYPIYVPLLPDLAQEAMGQVHPRAQITFDILMREGFETEHYIDIFDGGPTLHARTSGIRSIAQSRVAPVKIDDVPTKGGRPYRVQRPVAGLPGSAAGAGLGARQAGQPERCSSRGAGRRRGRQRAPGGGLRPGNRRFGIDALERFRAGPCRRTRR